MHEKEEMVMQNSDKRDNIISFLIKAKRATYAGKGAETVTCDIDGDFEWF